MICYHCKREITTLQYYEISLSLLDSISESVNQVLHKETLPYCLGCVIFTTIESAEAFAQAASAATL